MNRSFCTASQNVKIVGSHHSFQICGVIPPRDRLLWHLSHRLRTVGIRRSRSVCIQQVCCAHRLLIRGNCPLRLLHSAVEPSRSTRCGGIASPASGGRPAGADPVPGRGARMVRRPIAFDREDRPCWLLRMHDDQIDAIAGGAELRSRPDAWSTRRAEAGGFPKASTLEKLLSTPLRLTCATPWRPAA